MDQDDDLKCIINLRQYVLPAVGAATDPAFSGFAYVLLYASLSASWDSRFKYGGIGTDPALVRKSSTESLLLIRTKHSVPFPSLFSSSSQILETQSLVRMFARATGSCGNLTL